MSTAEEQISPPPSNKADTDISPAVFNVEKIVVKAAAERPSSSTPQGKEDAKNAAPRVIDDGGLPEVFIPEQKVAIDSDGLQPVVLPVPGETPAIPKFNDVDTVTPLHLLGDQPDLVDCPFCMRRVETCVEKKPSTATQ